MVFELPQFVGVLTRLIVELPQSVAVLTCMVVELHWMVVENPKPLNPKT
jgi:hypothetical protein